MTLSNWHNASGPRRCLFRCFPAILRIQDLWNVDNSLHQGGLIQPADLWFQDFPSSSNTVRLLHGTMVGSRWFQHTLQDISLFFGCLNDPAVSLKAQFQIPLLWLVKMRILTSAVMLLPAAVGIPFKYVYICIYKLHTHKYIYLLSSNQNFTTTEMIADDQAQQLPKPERSVGVTCRRCFAISESYGKPPVSPVEPIHHRWPATGLVDWLTD